MMKVIAKNKRAFFDYEILERFEAGLSLLGAEIKSIRESNVNIKGSFIIIRGSEAFWKGGFIKRWRYAIDEALDENRNRKLLLRKREILALEKALHEKGNTIVPLELKLVRGKAKLSFGLGRGKKKYDKRESIKKRDQERQMAQAKKR